MSSLSDQKGVFFEEKAIAINITALPAQQGSWLIDAEAENKNKERETKHHQTIKQNIITQIHQI